MKLCMCCGERVQVGRWDPGRAPDPTNPNICRQCAENIEEQVYPAMSETHGAGLLAAARRNGHLASNSSEADAHEFLMRYCKLHFPPDGGYREQ